MYKHSNKECVDKRFIPFIHSDMKRTTKKMLMLYFLTISFCVLMASQAKLVDRSKNNQIKQFLNSPLIISPFKHLVQSHLENETTLEDISLDCKRSLQHLKNGIKTKRLWAYKCEFFKLIVFCDVIMNFITVLGSFIRMNQAYFTSQLIDLGHFDRCSNTNHQILDGDLVIDFKRKYRIVRIIAPEFEERSSLDSESSWRRTLMERTSKQIFKFVGVSSYGFCFPSSCTNLDVKKITRKGWFY